jgi:Uma2 family endonuclease
MVPGLRLFSSRPVEIMATILSEKLVTAAEFQELEFDAPVELVQGEIIEMTRPGARHGYLCVSISSLLRNWAGPTGDFFVIGNDTGMITQRDPDTVRGPDVLVIRKEKLPEGKIPVGWLTVPPDLVIEVLSPHDQWLTVLTKTGEYLAAGVSEVWIIDPEDPAVHVSRADAAPRIVRGEESLSSESLLPGFSVTLPQLFAGI